MPYLHKNNKGRVLMDFKAHEVGYYSKGRCIHCGCATTKGIPKDFDGTVLFSKKAFCSNQCYWIWLSEREQDLRNTSEPLPEINYFTKHPDLTAEQKISALLSMHKEQEQVIEEVLEKNKFLVSEANRHLKKAIYEKSKNTRENTDRDFKIMKNRIQRLEQRKLKDNARKTALAIQLQNALSKIPGGRC